MESCCPQPSSSRLRTWFKGIVRHGFRSIFEIMVQGLYLIPPPHTLDMVDYSTTIKQNWFPTLSPYLTGPGHYFYPILDVLKYRHPSLPPHRLIILVVFLLLLCVYLYGETGLVAVSSEYQPFVQGYQALT